MISKEKAVQIIISAKDMASQSFKKLGMTVEGTVRKIERAGKTLERTGKKMTASITAPLAAAAVVAVKATSDMTEGTHKLEVAFAELAETSQKTIDGLSEVMGRSRVQFRNFAADLQSIVAPVLENRKAAAQLSTAITVLSADLASYMNMTDREVFDRLISGMLGSTQATERLGISLKANALELEAHRLGLEGNVSTMDEAVKMQLRFLAILRQSKDAQGDVVKTSGTSLVNLIKALKANTEELAVEIGERLMPLVVAAVHWAREAVDALRDLSPETKESVLQALKFAVVLGPVTLGLSAVIKGVALLGRGLMLLTKLATTNPWILLGLALGAIALSFEEVRKKGEELLRMLGLGGLIDTIKGTVDAFKELEDAASGIKFEVNLDDLKTISEVYAEAMAAIEEHVKLTAAKAEEELRKKMEELNKAIVAAFAKTSFETGAGKAIRFMSEKEWVDALGLDDGTQERVLDAITKFNDSMQRTFSIDRRLATIRGEVFDEWKAIEDGLKHRIDLMVSLMESGIDPSSEVFKGLADSIREASDQLNRYNRMLSNTQKIESILSDTPEALKRQLHDIGIDWAKAITGSGEIGLEMRISAALGEEFDVLRMKIDETSQAMRDNLEIRERAREQMMALIALWDEMADDPAALETIQTAIDELREVGARATIEIEGLADELGKLGTELIRARAVEELADNIGRLNLEAGDYVRSIQGIVEVLRDLPQLSIDIVNGFSGIRREISALFGGGLRGRLLGSATVGRMGWGAFSEGSTGTNWLGGIAGALAGFGIGGPLVSGIALGSQLINTLFPGTEKSDTDQALKAQIDEYNDMLKEWGASFESANLYFQKDSGFLGWRNLLGNVKWEAVNKEAAMRGAETAKSIIESMQTTFVELGEGLFDALFDAKSFDDFGKFVGRRLQQVLFESIVMSEAVKGPLQQLSAFMAEAVMDGLTSAEIEQIKEMSRAVFESVEPFADVAEEIARQFGLAEDAANGIGRALRNIPTGFKISLASYQAADPVPLASGGVVTRPTYAMIGESGPEAVIPLNKSGIGGGTYVDLRGATIYGMDDFERKVVSAVDRAQRKKSLSTYGVG